MARATTPKALIGQLRGDLDAIVGAALREDPIERYGSVAELAADLSLYLEGRPVRVRGHRLPYRLAKFARRQPLVSATALLVLVGVAVFVTWRLTRTDESGHPNAPTSGTTGGGSTVVTSNRGNPLGGGDAAGSAGPVPPARSRTEGRSAAAVQETSKKAGGDPADRIATTPVPTADPRMPTTTVAPTPTATPPASTPVLAEPRRTIQGDKDDVRALVLRYAELHTQQRPNRLVEVFPDISNQAITDVQNRLTNLEPDSYSMSVTTCEEPVLVGDGGYINCAIRETQTPRGRTRQVIPSRKYFRVEWKDGNWRIAEVK